MRENNRKLALEKALLYVETRALNPEEFIKLTEAILNYLTNKTKNNGRQQ